jgi:hypothetical protein
MRNLGTCVVEYILFTMIQPEFFDLLTKLVFYFGFIDLEKIQSFSLLILEYTF